MTCGKKNRAGGACGRPAGWGTDHVGQGACKLHGGATPIKSGRYSKIQRTRIRELLAEMENDPEPLDLLPEAQAIRALAIDYIERYDDFAAALIAWHESFDPKGAHKPTQIMDLAEASSILERAAKVVDLIQKHRKTSAITLETLNRVVEQMGVVVARHVKDAGLLAAIERDWNAIQVS